MRLEYAEGGELESSYVFENITKKEADNEIDKVSGESIYLDVFKSTDTRHLSLSFPRGESSLEYLNRHWPKIIEGIAKTVGVEWHHLAIIGYAVQVTEKGEDKPHAHLLVYSRKSQRNNHCWKVVSKAEVGELVKHFQNEMQINLKVKPYFNLKGWIGYLASEANMLADGAVVVRLPGFNLRILRSALKRKRAAKS